MGIIASIKSRFGGDDTTGPAPRNKVRNPPRQRDRHMEERTDRRDRQSPRTPPSQSQQGPQGGYDDTPDRPPSAFDDPTDNRFDTGPERVDNELPPEPGFDEPGFNEPGMDESAGRGSNNFEGPRTMQTQQPPPRSGGRGRDTDRPGRSDPPPAPRHYNMDLPMDEGDDTNILIQEELEQLLAQNDQIINLLKQIKRGMR